MSINTPEFPSAQSAERRAAQSRRRRTIAAVVGGVMALGGAGTVGAAWATSSGTPACGSTPTDPFADYNAWNVVAFEDVNVATEAEGSFAVGGELTFGSSDDRQQVAVATYSRDVAYLSVEELEAGGAAVPENTIQGATVPVGLIAQDVVANSDAVAGSKLDVQTGEVYLGTDDSDRAMIQSADGAGVYPDKNLFDSLFSKEKAIATAEKVAEEAASGHQVKVEKGEGAGETILDLEMGTTNYWNVTADELTALNRLTVKDPVLAGETSLVINVTDSEPVTLGLTMGGPRDAEAIVWNMPEVTHITQEGDSLDGSIFAPNAKLEHLDADIYGALVVNSLDLAGDYLEYWPFMPAPAPPQCPNEAATGTAAAASGEAGNGEIEVASSEAPTPTGSLLVRADVSGMAAGNFPEGTEVDVEATWSLGDGETETRTYQVPVNGEPIYGPQGLPVGTVVQFSYDKANVPETPAGYAFEGAEFLWDSAQTKDSSVIIRQGDLPIVTVKANYRSTERTGVTNGGITLSRGLVGVSTLAFDPDAQSEVDMLVKWTNRNGTEKSDIVKVPVDGTPVKGPSGIAGGTKVTVEEIAETRPVPHGYEWTGSTTYPREITILEGGDPDINVTVINSYVREDLGSIVLRKDTAGLVNAAVPQGTIYEVNASWVDSLGTAHTDSYYVPTGGTPVAGPLNLEAGTVVTFSEPANTVPAPTGYRFKGATLYEDDKPLEGETIVIEAGKRRNISITDTYVRAVDEEAGNASTSQLQLGASEAPAETKDIFLKKTLKGADVSAFEPGDRTSVNVSWKEPGGQTFAQTIHVPVDGTVVEGPTNVPASSAIKAVQVGHNVPAGLQLDAVLVDSGQPYPESKKDGEATLLTLTSEYAPFDTSRPTSPADLTATGAVAMSFAPKHGPLETVAGKAGAGVSALGLLVLIGALAPVGRSRRGTTKKAVAADSTIVTIGAGPDSGGPAGPDGPAGAERR